MTAATDITDTKLITGEELLEMGDIGPCELIDGRIVYMSPSGTLHALIEIKLARKLGNFVEEQKLGWTLGGEGGVYTRRNPDRVRGFDIAVLSKARAPKDAPLGFLQIAPELIVEIMSPDDRWQDVNDKIEEYFSIGVERVWIVEPDNRAVRVYRSPTDMHKLTEGELLKGEGVLAGFEIDVAALFEN